MMPKFNKGDVAYRQYFYHSLQQHFFSREVIVSLAITWEGETGFWYMVDSEVFGRTQRVSEGVLLTPEEAVAQRLMR